MTHPGQARAGPDWNDLLRAEMDAASLQFAPRRSNSGRLSGGFGYAAAAGPALSFEVAVRNGALIVQTTVDGPARAKDLQVVSGFNRLWETGRIVVDADQARLQLSGGYPIFARKSDAPLLRLIVGELYAVGVALDPASGGSWAAAGEAVAMARSAYPADVSGVSHQIAMALASSGHPFTPSGARALRQNFHEPDGGSFSVDIDESDDGFIRVRGRPAGAPPPDPDRLNRLTAAAPLGCFVSDGPMGPTHVCALPAAWMSVDARLLLWLIELESQMCALARTAPRADATLV
jgi:hypothetical protein